jgi:hypothetical protein
LDANFRVIGAPYKGSSVSAVDNQGWPPNLVLTLLGGPIVPPNDLDARPDRVDSSECCFQKGATAPRRICAAPAQALAQQGLAASEKQTIAKSMFIDFTMAPRNIALHKPLG